MKTYAVTITRVVTEETVVYVQAPTVFMARLEGRGRAKTETILGWDILDRQVSHVDAVLVPDERGLPVPNLASPAARASDAGTRPTGAGARA